jgi:hypothetical protein
MAQNLIMEAESSFETSLTIYQSTRSDIPDWIFMYVIPSISVMQM